MNGTGIERDTHAWKLVDAIALTGIDVPLDEVGNLGVDQVVKAILELDQQRRRAEGMHLRAEAHMKNLRVRLDFVRQESEHARDAKKSAHVRLDELVAEAKARETKLVELEQRTHHLDAKLNEAIQTDERSRGELGRALEASRALLKDMRRRAELAEAMLLDIVHCRKRKREGVLCQKCRRRLGAEFHRIQAIYIAEGRGSDATGPRR